MLAAGKDNFAYEVHKDIFQKEKLNSIDLEIMINTVLLRASGEFPNDVGGHSDYRSANS